jgi:WD40-like Beta Propeller Repeat
LPPSSELRPDLGARTSIAAALGVWSLIAFTAAGAQAKVGDPNGQIAYVAAGKIHVAAADGSGARELARGGAPSWSPDGTMIAFHSARVPGYGLDVYVMGRDGRFQRRLVSHPTAGGEPSDNTRDDFEPAWSPDGAYIAFATNRDGNAEIYRMDTTGHSTARLTNNPADERDPAWSPDGRTIAFVSNRSGNSDVYAMRADSTDVRQLTRATESDSAPAWSPDGRLLAFESVRDRNADIYLMAADGTGQRRLTNEPAAETRPTWSADGKSIVFTRSEGSGRRLVVMSLSGGAARSLTTPSESADAPSWQPGVDLALFVSRSSRTRALRPARVRVAVRNQLLSPAFDVALTISIPRTARVVAVRAGRGRCVRQRPLTCFARTLPSSATMFVELILRPQRCGSFAIRGSVSSLQREVKPGNNRRTARLAVAC